MLLLPALVYQVGYTWLALNLTSIFSVKDTSASQIALANTGAYLTSVFVNLAMLTIFGLLMGPIINGAYPLMVRNLTERKRLGIVDALKGSASKYFSILGSQMLVGFLVLVGALLVVVPGLIIYTWYYYVIPSIMLDKRGSLDGMRASKAFGRSRKWKTFLLILIGEAIVVVGIGIKSMIASSSVGTIITGIFATLTLTITLIMASHAYIKYR